MAEAINSTGGAQATMLSKPVVIPALSTNYDSKYIRAYPPELERYDISKEDFLRFLDKLSELASPSTPLSLLSVACGVVSLVPEPHCVLVGNIVSWVAEDAANEAAVKKTNIFLESANRKLWEPRGLHARIVKLATAAQVANMPILDGSRKDGKKVRVDKKAVVLPPVDDSSTEVQRESSSYLGTRSIRRLRALEPWTSPLDIQPPASQDKLEKQSALEAKFKNWDREQQEANTLKKRRQFQEKYEKKRHEVTERYERHMRDISEEESKVSAKAEKKGKSLEETTKAKYENRRAHERQEYEKKMARIEQQIQNRDTEEDKMRKIKMLLICRIEDIDRIKPVEEDSDW
ncbi:hypothetical protein CC1G_09489 [Coprinopsis cinerea okayama7|uniref:Uncharacterized protein n=1 Tax=Coprinopsis cinerea (strain Okayama-7 / 130 / ATCC MYA-4618 / FGSC 9003) TaxID=240176 RepID=A8PDI0_COPC7|nr:hypothetical protein CC1G_09489 [Coprinopsis cinerea okayama7\|eukprot:XP_001840605.1 hypothetical protein CC1G_09489 [Coprinopsis cinerea okayama7\